jgi:hypothetical protein
MEENKQSNISSAKDNKKKNKNENKIKKNI